MQFSFLAYFFLVLIFLSTNSLIQGVEEQPKAMKPAPGSLRIPDLTVHEPRHQWKKFVGMSGEEVKTAILHENNELNVQYLRHDAIVTMDFNPNRVRLFLDDNGKVSRTPLVG